MQDNEYGYKVCYKQHGKSKLKIHLIVNTYELAKFHILWYETHTPKDRETKRLIQNVEWLIFPIKTYPEYKRLWRGCPF